MDSIERDKKAEAIVSKISQLPTLPNIYSMLTKAMATPGSSAQTIRSIIEKDQALTIKVLKIVNSAFYGFPQKIKTIAHAVVILGFNEIKHLTLAVSLVHNFKTSSHNVCQFDYVAFWEHSLAVAVCSRIIAQKCKSLAVKDPDEAFTLGLVHDMGKLVEAQYMSEDFNAVFNQAIELKDYFINQENALLGLTHQEIGSQLAIKWKLPDTFAVAIKNHNNPDVSLSKEPVFILIAIVHLADILVKALNIGFSGDDYVPMINEACWEALGFTEAHIETIMTETLIGYDEVKNIIIN